MSYPSAMVVCDVTDVLTSGISTRVAAGVCHEVSVGHLILLFMFHHMFYHGGVAAAKLDKSVFYKRDLRSLQNECCFLLHVSKNDDYIPVSHFATFS